jgi:hypothetical protein
MKRTRNFHKRFYIDNEVDMDEYQELFNDPLIHIIKVEMLDEKTITHDNEGNTRTEIRPTYMVHWEESIL